jgi:hypothetical protein
MATLFFDEQMTITFIGKDQRSGKQCPPLNPTIVKIPRVDVRPRGADIVDMVVEGDSVTITANGNGTGTVTVVGYVDKQSTFPSLNVISILNHDPASDGGLWERNEMGSKSVINTLGIAISEEVTVLSPEISIEVETDITDPEIDCPEDTVGQGGPTGDGGAGQGGGDDPDYVPPTGGTTFNETGSGGALLSGSTVKVFVEEGLGGVLVGSNQPPRIDRVTLRSISSDGELLWTRDTRGPIIDIGMDNGIVGVVVREIPDVNGFPTVERGDPDEGTTYGATNYLYGFLPGGSESPALEQEEMRLVESTLGWTSGSALVKAYMHLDNVQQGDPPDDGVGNASAIFVEEKNTNEQAIAYFGSSFGAPPTWDQNFEGAVSIDGVSFGDWDIMDIEGDEDNGVVYVSMWNTVDPGQGVRILKYIGGQSSAAWDTTIVGFDHQAGTLGKIFITSTMIWVSVDGESIAGLPANQTKFFKALGFNPTTGAHEETCYEVWSSIDDPVEFSAGGMTVEKMNVRNLTGLCYGKGPGEPDYHIGQLQDGQMIRQTKLQAGVDADTLTDFKVNLIGPDGKIYANIMPSATWNTIRFNSDGTLDWTTANTKFHMSKTLLHTKTADVLVGNQILGEYRDVPQNESGIEMIDATTGASLWKFDHQVVNLVDLEESEEATEFSSPAGDDMLKAVCSPLDGSVVIIGGRMTDRVGNQGGPLPE